MTRVTEAAALTLQTWSRTAVAKQELAERRYAKQLELARVKERALSSMMGRASAETWARRALVILATVALVGMNLPAGVGSSDSPSFDSPSPVMATSSMHELHQDPSLWKGAVNLIAGATTSLLASRK